MTSTTWNCIESLNAHIRTLESELQAVKQERDELRTYCQQADAELITLKESHRAELQEAREEIAELAERMGRDVQFWKDETRRAIEAGDSSYVKAMKLYGATVELVDKYRDALHIIAYIGISGLSWQYDFEKCVNIAKEALEIQRLEIGGR